MLVKTKAFTDDKGNRMIFPGMVVDAERDHPTLTDVMFWAVEMDVVMSDLKSDPGWFEFDPEVFPHVSILVCSRAFKHGAATAYTFAGPEFDRVNEQRTDSERSASSGDGKPGVDDQERTGTPD